MGNSLKDEKFTEGICGPCQSSSRLSETPVSKSIVLCHHELIIVLMISLVEIDELTSVEDEW